GDRFGRLPGVAGLGQRPRLPIRRRTHAESRRVLDCGTRSPSHPLCHHLPSTDRTGPARTRAAGRRTESDGRADTRDGHLLDHRGRERRDRRYRSGPLRHRSALVGPTPGRGHCEGEARRMNLLPALALAVRPSALVGALRAPFEVMTDATGWRARVKHLPARIPYARGAAAVPAPPCYLVYLDGIGKRRFGDTRDGGQLVRAVLDTAPEFRVLGHIQPYSPLAVPLGSRPIWVWLRRRIGIVLFLHNVVQVFVAADRRYRPLYNQAVGVQIADQLRQAGYTPDSGVPVVLLSYSGGAQVATGAVAELRAQLHAPLILISIGGFHSGANSLTDVYSVHELTS